MLFCIPTFLAFQAVFQLAVNAVLVNITVDDAGVDPITGRSFVFSPEGAWSQGNSCSFCSIKPDMGQMHNGTWQDVTYIPNNGLGDFTGTLNLSLTFSGSAIYAFCAVHGFTNMTFFIDNKQVNHFSDNSVDGFTYNVPVFNGTSLSPGEHVFTLMNGAIDGSGNLSLVLFDFIFCCFRQEEDSNSGSGSAPPSQSAPLLSSLPSQSAPPPSRSVPLPSRSTPLASQSTPLPLQSASLSPQSAPLSPQSAPLSPQSAPLPSQSAPLPSQATAESKPQSSSKLKPGTIGGIITAIVVVSILVAIFFWRRRQNNPKVISDTAVQPLNNVSRTIPGDSLFTMQGPSVHEKRRAVGISSTNGATMPSTSHAETIASSNSVASSSSSLPVVISDTLPRSSRSSLPARLGQVETDAGPLLISSARTVEDTLPPDYNQVLVANQRLQGR